MNPSSGRPTLRRRLSTFELTATGVGVILGAGIYVLIGHGAGLAGDAVWIPFTLGAIAAAFTGLSYAELASAHPAASASFEYTRRAFGSRIGFLAGWVMLFAMTIPAAAVALGFAGYLADLVRTPELPIALLLISVSALLLWWGIAASVRVGVVFALITVAGLAMVIAVSVRFIGGIDYLELPQGVTGLLKATALLFFAFLGFEQVANLSEEARDPRRGVPTAIILAVAITSLIYVLVGISAVSVVGWERLSGSSAPLALVVREATGAELSGMLSVIALFATASTVLFSLLAASRGIFGMARDGSLPNQLAGLSRRRTPLAAIITVALAAIVFALSGRIDYIADLTNASVLFAFTLVNLSLIRLRMRHGTLGGAFTTPLRVGRVPVTPVLGALTALAMLAYTGLHAIAFLALVVATGLVIDWCLRRGENGGGTGDAETTETPIEAVGGRAD